MDPTTAEAAQQLAWHQDPAALTALYRNACMIVAALAAMRIAWLGIRRYKTEPVWQLVAVGGLVTVGAYFAIIGVAGDFLVDSFFALTHRGPAEIGDFVYFMKAGLILLVFGAFGVSKNILS